MLHSIAATDSRFCPSCKLRLWLIGVRATAAGHEVQKFECSNCSYSTELPSGQGGTPGGEPKSGYIELRLRGIVHYVRSNDCRRAVGRHQGCGWGRHSMSSDEESGRRARPSSSKKRVSTSAASRRANAQRKPRKTRRPKDLKSSSWYEKARLAISAEP